MDPVDASEERPAQARCPRCGMALELHQPDETLPDRFLGTCPGCRRWYLVDADRSSVTLLPDHENA